MNTASKTRILVIDDQPAHIREIYGMLAKDYQVLQATTGERGTQLAKSSAPAVIMLNVGMSSPDGYAVCETLRADPAAAKTPVIFLFDPEKGIDRPRCIELGATFFLSKPVDATRLLSAVANSLTKSVNAPETATDKTLRPDSMTRLGDIAEIDMDAGLRNVAGAEALFLSVLKKVCINHPGIATEIRQALAEGQTATAQGLAHTAKTICNTVGAVGLGTQAAEIEQHLKHGRSGMPDAGPFETRYIAMVRALSAAILP